MQIRVESAAVRVDALNFDLDTSQRGLRMWSTGKQELTKPWRIGRMRLLVTLLAHLKTWKYLQCQLRIHEFFDQ